MADRKRLPHLSMEEKETLLTLTVKYRNVVENKRTDAVSSKEKEKGWFQIEEEFNAQGASVRRPWQLLKKSWENIKFAARKANTAARQHSLGTGGGGPSRAVVDPFLARVDTVMPHLNMRISSEFDSDGVGGSSTSTSSDSPAELEVEPAREPDPVDHDEDPLETTRNEVEYEVAIQDTPCRPTNCVNGSKKRKVDTPREAVAKFLKTKADEELSQMRELHQKRLEHEELLFLEKMRNVKEIHDLELEEKRLKFLSGGVQEWCHQVWLACISTVSQQYLPEFSPLQNGTHSTSQKNGIVVN
ncbi:uncharacterized protein LOC124164970 [Ischnura elegans]|uniref:uncharacterized protein LOC124164970 n=1 Tax=Ischnura elegans TaxID=197161 RepID=UPI001ED8ADEC|nr:uncharacterized protein LOC124164970 [Ischnura elegans]